MNKFNQEIENALAARQAGNEGKARVCARRAAGLVAADYMKDHGIPFSGPSAYDHLRSLQNLPDKPTQSAAQIEDLLKRLLMRVTPEFTLPPEIDLIEDAWQLKKILFEEE